jgi:hypothetical protein
MRQTSPLQTHGAVITRDKLPIGQAHSPEKWLSDVWGAAAGTNGYEIVRDDVLIRGYMEYALIQGRRGYGVNGFIVRAVENVQALSLSDASRDYHFSLYVIAPTLSAISEALNCTDGGNSFDAIRGQISGWVQIVAARYDLNPGTDF